ncbi:hypothetical protein AOLI_G00329670, partial [Acnodon oligacanthus]
MSVVCPCRALASVSIPFRVLLSNLFSFLFQKRKSSSSVQLMESSESTNTTIEDEDTR